MLFVKHKPLEGPSRRPLIEERISPRDVDAEAWSEVRGNRPACVFVHAPSSKVIQEHASEGIRDRRDLPTGNGSPVGDDQSLCWDPRDFRNIHAQSAELPVELHEAACFIVREVDDKDSPNLVYSDYCRKPL